MLKRYFLNVEETELLSSAQRSIQTSAVTFDWRPRSNVKKGVLFFVNTVKKFRKLSLFVYKVDKFDDH